MQTVIKGTKTIEEYKRVKATMEELAEKMSKAHQNACETWEHGEVKRYGLTTVGTSALNMRTGNGGITTKKANGGKQKSKGFPLLFDVEDSIQPYGNLCPSVSHIAGAHFCATSLRSP